MSSDAAAPPRLVADGYARIASRYREWAAGIGDDARDRWLARLTESLADGARMLDLGCGSGVPTARELARRFAVTGIDASGAQIAAARAAVPGASFEVADMTTAAFPDATFSAVVAFYSIIHVRLAEWPGLFGRIHDWLAPGGLFLATLGATEGEGIEADWLGVPMFFAGHAPGRNLELLSGAGFDVTADAIETTTEPDHGAVSFHWVLARRAS